jgi:DNA helicase-2/ATP-dependent DNA helicase PcrA
VPSLNEIIIAAAGGGKTTRIVECALKSSAERSAIVTYTQNNVREIERKAFELNNCIPTQMEVWSWYSLLLRELARPYQASLHDRRIDRISWVEGRSVPYVSREDAARFFFSDGTAIYSDKLSRFICEANTASGGAVIRRLEQRFDRIYIDEIQDMAGYDIDLIELLLKSQIKLTLVGDHRQATFKTNNSAKNSAYSGTNIIAKFRKWHDAGHAVLSYEQETHRCHQKVADLADCFFPGEPKTISRNSTVTGHDGVFIVPTHRLAAYIKQYQPQVLRLDKRTDCGQYGAMNFGDSKGLTFDRVLIFPHGKGRDWLKSADFKHVAGSAAKMYVGITRARYSVGIVYDGTTSLIGIESLL